MEGRTVGHCKILQWISERVGGVRGWMVRLGGGDS